MSKELELCLEYCKEQNGMPLCKNCGLSQEIIDNFANSVAKEAKLKMADELVRKAHGGGNWKRIAYQLAEVDHD
jgi:hypothetical protein